MLNIDPQQSFARILMPLVVYHLMVHLAEQDPILVGINLCWIAFTVPGA
jgi:hypothetical protein